MILKHSKTATLTSMLLAGVAMPAMAQSDDSASAYPLMIQNDCSVECGFPDFADSNEAAAFLHNQFFNDGEGGAPTGAGGSPEGANGPSGLGLGLGLGLNAPQVVYLDFQPGEPEYTFTLFGITLTLPDISIPMTTRISSSHGSRLTTRLTISSSFSMNRQKATTSRFSSTQMTIRA